MIWLKYWYWLFGVNSDHSFTTMCCSYMGYLSLAAINQMTQWEKKYLQFWWFGGGNRSTRRKQPTCRKSLTNFIITLVVIGTNCTGSCKSNYHTIMTMTIRSWILSYSCTTDFYFRCAFYCQKEVAISRQH